MIRARLRRGLPLGVAAVALAAALAAVLVVALERGGGRAAQGPAAERNDLERALKAHLEAKYLSVVYVQCTVPRGGAQVYEGVRVLRCGVDFGDPHIVVYCAARVHGRFATDREIHALRCGPLPDAG